MVFLDFPEEENINKTRTTIDETGVKPKKIMEVPSSAQEGVRRCDDLAMDSREDASDTTVRLSFKRASAVHDDIHPLPSLSPPSCPVDSLFHFSIFFFQPLFWC